MAHYKLNKKTGKVHKAEDRGCGNQKTHGKRSGWRDFGPYVSLEFASIEAEPLHGGRTHVCRNCKRRR